MTAAWCGRSHEVRFDPLRVEHRDERTGAVIPQIDRHGMHRLAPCETFQREHDVKLLAPAAEAHARLLQDQAIEGALARRDPPRPFPNRGPAGQIGGEGVGNLP